MVIFSEELLDALEVADRDEDYNPIFKEGTPQHVIDEWNQFVFYQDESERTGVRIV